MSLFDVTPSAVFQPGYGAQTRNTLKNQISLAPQLYQANEQYQPLYGALNLQNVDQFLNGTPEQVYDTYSYTNPIYRGGGGGGNDPFGTLLDLSPGSPTLLGGLFGGGDSHKGELLKKGGWKKSGSATRGAQRGFLDMYLNDIIPSTLQAQTKQRASDISDVARLGPESRAALRLANPDSANLLDQLYAQANSDLGLGTQLNQSEERLLQQSARSGQSARGMGLGPNDNFNEALMSLNYGRGLQDQRRQFAGGVMAQMDDFYGDPFQAILGRSSQSGAQNLGGQGLGASHQGNLFSPESSYAQDVYNTSLNQRQSVNNAGASANAAMLGGIISAIGGVGGSAAMACWAAREVYGAENPRWKQFRHWLFTRGPLWFRSWYLQNGPAWAEWLRGHPRDKARVRTWMDARIKEVE